MKALALLTLAACYGAAPGKPPAVPVPPLSDDAPIVVHSETKTTIESVDRTASTCPQGHAEGDPACVVTHYQSPEPVTRTHTSASYGGQPLTVAQFKVMTDAKRNERLALLDDLSTRCRHANIPRYAGIGLMLGGIITGVIVKGDAGKAIVWTGFGAGTASYALGYFAFGGRQCVEARQLYEALDYSLDLDATVADGSDTAQEMQQLAEAFNAAHGGGHASAGGDPPAPASHRLKMRR